MAASAESYTDVLIVGAGPAGLAVAYWMARCGINARVVDKRDTKILRGHADGLRSRTIELFDSMGIAHRVMQEGDHSAELMYWRPNDKGELKRAGNTGFSSGTASPYKMAMLSQGRVERFILDAIKDSSDLEVERGVVAESLSYDQSPEDHGQKYPITVKLRTLSEEEATPFSHPGISKVPAARDDQQDLIQKRKHPVGTVETVRAKYLIGCDGAHSWTRKQLNIPFEGSNTDHIWGVVDMVPITDFPDIRRTTSLDSRNGHLLIIPREGNVVRLYVPLQEDEVSATFDRSAVTLDTLRNRVKKILSPFSFDFKICHWWTVYQVGRRLAQSVNKGRVYLAGDAVHTHSPKVGLGMNVSFQDGFNLGWKVALAVRGVAHPSILDTYASERHQLAKMLIDFDRRWSAFFLQEEQKQKAVDTSSAPEDNSAAMSSLFRETELFTEGHASFYGKSCLVHKGSTAMAKHLVAGERFLPAIVRNQAGGRPSWTTRLLESDGRFRILILAGDMRLKDQKNRVSSLGEKLTELLMRFTPPKSKLDSIIEVKAIHTAPWLEVELSDFPPAVHQFDEEQGWDYSKVWSDSKCFWEPQCVGNAYEVWGVDKSRGAIVALRPDQYIGWMGEIEDVAGLTQYFERVLQEVRPRSLL
ncbi:phenol 2-monooxygenase [Aspergillus heteromorphus CBS 117.55]|uniref:Phenol 2-monooxygenase n=1 Tax=Aspergillus heteromorphus CBS 117.55 TaxID=1448321 RepID=A0A317UXU7_9EURO|nr:phenol 2-monooxygenase [Aspergillus heteromorphus CBS 117.55]PWY66416.1 phenol 2-monooxygenase [Aspergillus heteromorphus CBS 117.55]